jgi:predicted helicase
MSIQLINQYYNKRDRIVQYGGSKNELSIRDPFKDLPNYRFADNKEEVIELIGKVTTVSMETMAIINRMGNEKE